MLSVKRNWYTIWAETSAKPYGELNGSPFSFFTAHPVTWFDSNVQPFTCIRTVHTFLGLCFCNLPWKQTTPVTVSVMAQCERTKVRSRFTGRFLFRFRGGSPLLGASSLPHCSSLQALLYVASQNPAKLILDHNQRLRSIIPPLIHK